MTSPPPPSTAPHRDRDPDADAEAEAEAEADAVYAAEDLAVAAHPLRRFTRFAQIEAHVGRLTASRWWDERFPAAPVEVCVQRRSHTATASCATVRRESVGDGWAVIALVDGTGWGLETVLHELAHVGAGIDARHGPRFRAALADLWRHEAGLHAWLELDAALGRFGDAAAEPVSGRCAPRDDGPPAWSPRRTRLP